MLSRAISRRSVQSSISAVRFYTEGATGAPRAAGSSDSFNKREKAVEDLYVRQLEKEKLAALRASLKKQKESLAEVEKHLDQISENIETETK
ncbi:uncharacterized protein SAPINGB_P003108 [Magnusiomyces paraingens]|uniref:ATPase inhibitor, mitochondrial n=1 Tax=Magnusiomyces paraingens TaxID=2606893 RepID=A0A5E8BIJ1_9ASCO|nr:uncharacterized protein SAPINGB_P003108 [Saprochaete ingens]VVT51474.1 unnamed protein product [Saprochaete ingens]